MIYPHAVSHNKHSPRKLREWACIRRTRTLSFGASKERNSVWERLQDPTREQLDTSLMSRSDHKDHFQAFNVAKSVARFSFGLTKKDDTGKVIDRFVERIESNSSSGYCNDFPEGNCGVFDLYGPFLSSSFAKLCSYTQMFI